MGKNKVKTDKNGFWVGTSCNSRQVRRSLGKSSLTNPTDPTSRILKARCQSTGKNSKKARRFFRESQAVGTSKLEYSKLAEKKDARKESQNYMGKIKGHLEKSREGRKMARQSNILVERTRPGPQPEILNFAKDWSEKERLKEGLTKTIDSSNKGFQMLAKMGYKSGESLGKSNSGIVDPIPIVVKTNRKGLGSNQDHDGSSKSKNGFHMTEKRKSDLKRPNSGRPFQPDPKKFVCSVCNKKFKHSGSLQSHFDAVHSKKFVCNVCQRKFTQSGVLQSHFNIFHSALKSNSSDLKKDVDVDELEMYEIENSTSIEFIYNKIDGLSRQTLENVCKNLHLDIRDPVMRRKDMRNALKIHYKTKRDDELKRFEIENSTSIEFIYNKIEGWSIPTLRNICKDLRLDSRDNQKDMINALKIHYITKVERSIQDINHPKKFVDIINNTSSDIPCSATDQKPISQKFVGRQKEEILQEAELKTMNTAILKSLNSESLQDRPKKSIDSRTNNEFPTLSKLGYKSGKKLDKSNSGRNDDEPLEVHYLGSDGRVFKYKKEYDISYFAWKRDIIPKEKYGFLLAEKRFDQKFGKEDENFDIKEEPMEN